MTFTIIEPTDPARPRAEEAVRALFAGQYGAVVDEFAPTLVALNDRHGALSCVAGIRFAKDGFFSERYLDHPIEAVLGPLWNGPVRRDQIAEVSNLAGMKARSSRLLIAHVIGLCRERSITWAFFTAGERLRVTLRRIGILTLDLGPAVAGKIDRAEAWGTYYATDPHVVAIHDSMVAMDDIPYQRAPIPSLAKGYALG